MGHAIEQTPSRAFDEFRLPTLAFEREAAERYGEFAAWLAERGRGDMAELCTSLARSHRELSLQIGEPSAAVTAVAIDAARQSWIAQGSPQPRPVEFFYRLAGARQLIEIALAEEEDAARRFEAAARASQDEPTQRLAAELGAKARECARRLQATIEGAAGVDWEAMIASGGGPCLALGAERRLRPPAPKD
jgi:hypothetical protein